MAATLIGQTPNDVHRLALADLVEIAKVDSRAAQRTRYLDVHTIDAGYRARFIQALAFALNSTSWRSTIFRPAVVGESLVRIDLDGLGWDRHTRDIRLAQLEKPGVRFANKDRLRDPWELIAAKVPHFRACTSYRRGWIDPRDDLAARTLSQSSLFIARADWLLPRLMMEKENDGFYSDLLLLPDSESDLYKLLSIDIGRFDSEDGFRRGTFLVNGRDSYVALHNRELQHIRSPVGQDVGYLWRTFDVARDDDQRKRVLNAFTGSLALDGREIIFTLPNGLQGYRLSNNKGNRVSEVPSNIAQDKRTSPQRERRVLNSYKCVDCHGRQDGIVDPQDQARDLMVRIADLGLIVNDYDLRKSAERKRSIEEYYLAEMGPLVDGQRASYARVLQRVNGLSGSENAEALVRGVEDYLYNEVTLDRASVELGAPKPEAVRRLSRIYGEAAVLAVDRPIPRSAWDQIFGDVMLSERYPWDH